MPFRKALLLDRDGVINVDKGYVGHIEGFDFFPGIFPFLRAAQDRGYRLAVVTNQGGVARGYYTPQDFETLSDWMCAQFRKEGIAIDLVLGCYEHKAGSVAPYNRDSYWRKPNPGMILEALRRLNADPARSAMIGDHPRDMEAALAGGIGTCLWLTDKTEDMPNVRRVADYKAALAALA